MLTEEKKYTVLERWVAWGSFFLLLITYWLTVAPTVSFWDCPEYVSAAYLLEVGHPPGNPVWMLVERMFTLLAPSPQYAALAVNMSSGLFTAFAAFFLAKTIFRVALWVLLKLPRHHIPAPVAAAGGALTGALTFGWLDSTWYSAVEAEVYAMSIFMTSLCVWLMTKWAGTRNRRDSWKLLILIAYLFGLSIGVHQLNLLCIPALALIWAVKRGITGFRLLAGIFILSLVAVACVLLGMMPSTISLASYFELLAVNVFGWPLLSGVVIYVVLLGISLIIAITATRMSDSRVVMASACFPAIFLSGIFIFSDHTLIGLFISLAASVFLVSGSNFSSRRLCLAIWMLAMLLTGFSSYALIPIRGSVNSPANNGMPDNPFAFADYLNREQYGSSPLFYGPTPYSKPMLHEEYDSAGKPYYDYFEINVRHLNYIPKEDGIRLPEKLYKVPGKDKAANRRLLAREADGYIARSVASEYLTTPELNMWFPRITSTAPPDLRSYSEWIGMDSASMVEVEISEAFDSLGNPVAKADFNGQRHRIRSYRPTYMQNLQWLLGYQTGYMYWRYFMWNFMGRQNDLPSMGEVQKGNFITGVTAVDNLMLGAQEDMPAEAGSENKGRNLLFGLPLILGIMGICWLLRARKRGVRTCAIIAVLFVMTGLAIVIYLNQSPGQPRERDYSFLGSFWAFCIYIGFGAISIARLFRSVWAFVVPLAIAGYICYVNYDDHDRSGRYVARNYAVNVLISLEPDAIIFVSGDNFTFPLWYAQEVEGVRTDVRVINTSYLSSPVYAANQLRQWRESKGVPSTLKRNDLIGGAMKDVCVPELQNDTVAPDAREALLGMLASDNLNFPSRNVRLKVADDMYIDYDLRLMSGGRKHPDLSSLMIFNIIATNAAMDKPRPIYWINGLKPYLKIGLKKYTTEELFASRFGILPVQKEDSLLWNAVEHVLYPNVPGMTAYMDEVPASKAGELRARIVMAARRLFDSGQLDKSIGALLVADRFVEGGQLTYPSVLLGDTLFDCQYEMGRLMVECADTLRRSAGGDKRLQARSTMLESLGRKHLKQHRDTRSEWLRYRDRLPARLKNKMGFGFPPE